jgi:hypothetical protein
MEPAEQRWEVNGNLRAVNGGVRKGRLVNLHQGSKTTLVEKVEEGIPIINNVKAMGSILVVDSLKAVECFMYVYHCPRTGGNGMKGTGSDRGGLSARVFVHGI